MRFVVRVHQGGWTYPQLLAVWREGGRLGYDGGSLYDLLGHPGPECWTALTALTAATERLIAVPLTLANPYRHPALVAKMAATLDDLSGGRLILGLGAGGAPGDAAAFGVPFPPTPKRVAQLEEAVQVMRLLWRGGGSIPGLRSALEAAAGRPCPASSYSSRIPPTSRACASSRKRSSPRIAAPPRAVRPRAESLLRDRFPCALIGCVPRPCPSRRRSPAARRPADATAAAWTRA